MDPRKTHLLVDTHLDGQQPYYELKGRLLDEDDARILRDALQSAAPQAAINHLVVDARGLEYMVSVGLTELVRALNRVRRAGRSIWLVGTRGVVLQTIAAVKLDGEFKFATSVEEAYAQMGGASA